MPVDSTGFAFLDFFTAALGIKAFLVLFLVFYAFFALILFRQISIMNKKLPTPLSPFLKFVSIVHMGISVAVLLLVIGNY